MTLELVTAGESHGPALVAIVSGLPAGLMLDKGAIDAFSTINPAGSPLTIATSAGPCDSPAVTSSRLTAPSLRRRA